MELPFRLAATQQEVRLRFDTDGAQRTLTIDVPRPISPAELGQPNDARKLGIGISEIEIGTTRAAP
jgi:phosphoglycerol transferase